MDSSNLKQVVSCLSIGARHGAIVRVPEFWTGESVSLLGVQQEGKEAEIGELLQPTTEQGKRTRISALDLSGISLTGCIKPQGKLRDGIVRLHLRFCALNDNQVTTLFQQLATCLVVLDLSGNTFSYKWLQMATVQERLLQLYELGLSSTGMKDDALMNLSRILCASQELEALLLDRNEITDRGCMEGIVAGMLRTGANQREETSAELHRFRKLHLHKNMIRAFETHQEILLAAQHKQRLVQVLTIYSDEALDHFSHQQLERLHNLEMVLRGDPLARRRLLENALFRDRIAFCPFECTNQGILEREMDMHLSQCSRAAVQCPHCSSPSIERGELKRHIETRCLERPYPCPNNCGQVFFRKDTGSGLADRISTHVEHLCDRRVLFCNLGCGEKLEVKHLQAHTERFCPERLVSCNISASCSLKVRACRLEDHIASHELEQQQVETKTQELGNRNDDNEALDPFANSILEQVEQLCRSIGKSKQERENRRREKEQEVASQAKDLFQVLQRNLEKARHERIARGRAALDVYYRSVPLICPNQGCHERVLIGDLSQHEITCIFAKILCPNGCGEGLLRKDFITHDSDRCPERLVECNRDHCDHVKFKAKERDRHDREKHAYQ